MEPLPCLLLHDLAAFNFAPPPRRLHCLASFCREIRKLLISNLLNDFRPPQETDRRARYFMTRWQSSLTTRRRAAYD